MDGSAALDGVYNAPRAAALAGMPLSTLHYWAREGIVVPRASASRPKLWSYEDLMAVRAVAWLRRGKVVGGVAVQPSSMHVVRRALSALREVGLEVWSSDDGARVLVDPAGRVFVRGRDGTEGSDRQLVAETVDLIGPFEIEGHRGPDLARPRPMLRIVPGKLAGAPHVSGTRIETEALAALALRGFEPVRIAALYPELAAEAISQAIDLERQLGTIVARVA